MIVITEYGEILYTEKEKALFYQCRGWSWMVVGFLKHTMINKDDVVFKYNDNN